MIKSKTMLDNGIALSAEMLLLGPASLGLYYMLNSFADDYGIVGGQPIMKVAKLRPRYLEGLINAGFLKLLKKEECLLYINDWAEHNSNRDVRYIQPSRYMNLLSEKFPNERIIVPYVSGFKKDGRPKFVKKYSTALDSLKILEHNKDYIDKAAELSRDAFISLENPREKMCQEKISQEKRREEFSSLDKEKESIFSSPGYEVPNVLGKNTVVADSSDDSEEQKRIERNNRIAMQAKQYADNNPDSKFAKMLEAVVSKVNEKGE